MKDRKLFDEKELHFSLSAHVPENNCYRQLKQCFNLDLLYELTREHYGRCGQHSIGPVVFFKLCLVGHLENIASDRKLIEHCSLRLDPADWNCNVLLEYERLTSQAQLEQELKRILRGFGIKFKISFKQQEVSNIFNSS
ncbi:transposase [Pontibacter sp. E15-1]|uniref:transposase n=1 Tax=Pontibacter sp. E15-1 TaxID=2919918 RepID=UPI001F4FB790|nr:transposase [Pontibacter sp. E15-1]MCJ8167610.1 transposase [Pontibacter sp. E15-1]